MSVKSGLAPIARRDARLFILGSLPGDASLAARQYYAHPSNQFWRLVGSALNEDLHALGYAARLDRLAARGIGLWDVFGSARRSGSLDQAIRAAQHNRFEDLLRDFPDIRVIAFNGATAARSGRKAVEHVEGIAFLDLPSSSAAYTRPFVEKAALWSRLAEYASPAA